MCHQRAEVTCVFHRCMNKIVYHVAVNLIYTARRGLQQSSTGYNRIKFNGDAGFRECFVHQRGTVWQLVVDMRKVG